MEITAGSPIRLPYNLHSHKSEAEEFTYSYKSCVSREQTLAKLSELSLDHYNSTHKCQFDLVDLLYIECVTTWKDFEPGYMHLSFTARSRDSPTQLKLFFAEVYNRETNDSFIPSVNSCQPVDPGTPFCFLGCGVCNSLGAIYHPSHRRYLKGGSSRYATRNPILHPLEESANKLLHEKYIFKPSIQFLYPEEDVEFRKVIDTYAMASMRSYAMLKKCVLEFQEVVSAVRFFHPLKPLDRFPEVVTDWVHLTFLAQNADSWVELFFAEVSLDDYWVTTCVNLSRAGLGSKSEAKASCRICAEYCRSSFPHPEGEYIAGIEGGTFVDALDKECSWKMKVDLEEK